MSEHTYVVSDVHLGGSPALRFGEGTIDFQMCPPQSRRRFARFVHALRHLHPEGCRLVINGDLVDFPAEELDGLEPAPAAGVRPRFESFTGDPERAVAKLQRIVE